MTTVQFDPERAQTSYNYAYNCYVRMKNNQLEITDEQKTEFDNKWQGYFAQWNQSKDITDYQLDDDDFSNYKDNGKENVTDNTDKGSSTKAVANDAACVVSAATPIVSDKIYSSAWGNFFSKHPNSTSDFQNGANNVVNDAKHADNVSNASIYVGCAVAAATAALYWATNPDKQANESVEELKTIYQNEAQAELESTQSDLNDIGDASTDKATDAEDKQKELEEKKKEYETALAKQKEIQESINNGEKTYTQKDLDDATLQLALLGEDVEVMSEDVSTIQDGLDAKNDEFDTQAERAATVQGQIEEGESIDSSVKAQEIMTLATQTLNVASGTYNSVKAFASASPSNLLGYVFGALGAAGAAGSAAAVIQEAKYISNVNEEQGVREDTSAILDSTNGNYDTNLNIFAESNDYTSDVSDDINAFYDSMEGKATSEETTEPDETTPDGTTADNIQDTGTTTQPTSDGDDKKKTEAE